MFDFHKYIEVFNAGNDKEMVEQFWVDDLVVNTGKGEEDNDGGILIKGKESWLRFLAFAHDGVREIMRIQSLIEGPGEIFAEIDMDFHVLKERPDYPFGSFKPGDLFTVKMFSLYFIRDGKIAELKMARWPPNVGVTDPPTRGFGPPPPAVGG